MAFDAAAVLDLFDKVQSHAAKLGLFDHPVGRHEPKSAPGHGLWCAVWVQAVAPVRSSGLVATSGRVEFRIRIGSSMIQEPQDDIDPAVLTACTTLLNDYSGDFTLGGTVRDVDLLGAEGTPLSAVAGYVTIGQHMYRVMEITLPVIINAVWLQGGSLVAESPGSYTLSVDNLAVANNATVGGVLRAGSMSGVFLRAPTVYAPASPQSPTTSSATLAAFDSANINTGNFTAPPSGSVLVGASFFLQPPSTVVFAFGLAAHGTVSPVIGQTITGEVSSVNVRYPTVLQFLVTGLTPGSTYNFDLLGCSATQSLVITALGASSTTPTGTLGGPVVMTVQGV